MMLEFNLAVFFAFAWWNQAKTFASEQIICWDGVLEDFMWIPEVDFGRMLTAIHSRQDFNTSSRCRITEFVFR